MSLSCLQFLLLSAMVFAFFSAPAVAQQSLGELYATDASVKGSVVLAGSGTSVLSGSAIQAGARAATLKLDRGGNILVCPGTNLTTTASPNGRSMLFSLNSGSLEMNYPLGASADTLLTPDFRLLLPGPATVHVAVRISPNGDTCVQSLASNASALVVSESMGDSTYQVKSDEAVIFKGGHISDAVHSRESCGCPAPPPVPVMQAAVSEPTPPPPPPPSTTKTEAVAPTTVAVVPSADEHISVEAPFVFHGDDPIPDLTENVATLRVESNSVIQLDPVVLPPKVKQAASAPGTEQAAAAKPEKKHGFFAAVGAFFASIFH